MELNEACARLEQLLIRDLGPEGYRAIDRDSGFLGAGEEGLWVECLAGNLAENAIPIADEVRDLLLALFRMMHMDATICDLIPSK